MSIAGYRLTADIPLRFAEWSGPEAVLKERGDALRARAVAMLKGLLPGGDVQGTIDHPARSAMFKAHSAALTSQAQSLSAEVDHLLGHHDLRSQFEAMRDGRLAAPSGIFDPRSIEAAGAQLRIGAAAAAVTSAGLTLRVTAVDQQLPSLRAMCWAFDAAYGVRSTANVYVTAGTVPGTVGHFDHHDVFLLQITGRKGWRVAAPGRRPAPGVSGESSLDRADWEGTLECGDVLYLPRGHIHQAAPLDELSIHVSIAVRRPAYADVFGDVWAFLGGTGGWVEDVPGVPVDGQSIATALEGLLQPTDHDGPPVHQIATHVLAGYRARLPPRPRAPFGRVVAATAHPLDWSYRWALPTEPMVVDRPGGGFALAGWVIEPELCSHDVFHEMVGAERWTPHPECDPAVTQLIAALLELDVLDPLPSGGQR